MDLKARKWALRRAMVARILALDPADRARQEAALGDRFAGLPGLEEAGTVLLYGSAFPEEIGTWTFLRRTLERGQRLVLPRVERAETRLRLFQVTDLDADLVPGTLAIPEPRPECHELDPEAIDWVLVPGLAFDRLGYRLGRGAGHYDRLLPRLRPEAPRWALALEPQLVEALPTGPHDQPIDGVATPGGIVATGRGRGSSRFFR